MKTWRDAASLIVAVRVKNLLTANKTCSSKDDYKTLVLRRHGSSSFMPTKVVFPGGTVSEADRSSAWNELFQKVVGHNMQEIQDELNYPTSKYPMIKENTHWQIHPDIAFRICAIRETFEESGFLVALNKSQYNKNKRNKLVESLNDSIFVKDSSFIKEWKDEVHKNPFKFINLCHKFEIMPNIWALQEWNNWLTPILQSKGQKGRARFDTMFYVCCFDGDSLPSVFPDQSETTEAYWSSPRDLLSQNEEENDARSNMAAPQVYELNEMCKFPTLDELKMTAYSRNYSNKDRLRFLPAFKYCKGGYMLLFPGDHLYPDDPFSHCTEQGLKEILDITTEGVSVIDDKPKNRIIYKDDGSSGIVVKQC